MGVTSKGCSRSAGHSPPTIYMPKALGIDDLEGAITSLNPSQKEFIFSPERNAALEGGWGCGKSTALCIKGLVLSAYYPFNTGILGRYNASDLDESTIPSFFEVCPPSWIKNWHSTKKHLTLRNGSVIYFKHIHDPNPKRRALQSINAGWVGVDQAEEVSEADWDTALGRLRNAHAKRKFGFLVANPNGHDWIYRKFMPGIDVEKWGEREYFRAIRREGYLGLAVRSEENMKSNGGHVEDDYFENRRAEMPPEWVARYLDCSFIAFTGKIYKQYQLDSVHNVDPFPIPDHWPICVSIDVGGSAAWSIGCHTTDEMGNVITFDELHEPDITIKRASDFIKGHHWWNSTRTSYLIDPENRPVATELAEHGIHCIPAQKPVQAGITRAQGYVMIDRWRPLPPWYRETQRERFRRFSDGGSPKWFIFNRLTAARNEMDQYVWGEDGKPKKENDHFADELRYFLYAQPRPARTKFTSQKRESLRLVDPASAREWDLIEQRSRNREMSKVLSGWREVDATVSARAADSHIVPGWRELEQMEMTAYPIGEPWEGSDAW